MRVPASLLAMFVVVGWSAAAAAAPESPVNDSARFQSTLADYRGFSNEPVRPWRESNEAMERLGGHMGHVEGAMVNSDIEPTDRNSPSEKKTPEGSQP